ncbi:uncharacterized protein LOC122837289 [Gambusia affinis]|uniref:uncharacterized protein LOC122837289 n=1 Tax=Gambusia affinis TaxID=33528 RepID=UPI001CDD54EB|nr:uncharacterized protein LOC122837289 [Gambusia affinis]XP_043983476.1 uncharacterized protein LOC122837289 [Gambusia affinis]
MMTSQVLLGASLFAWLILDVCGLSVKGLQSQHQSSGGTSAGGNVDSHRAGSGSSDPAGVFMRQPSWPQSVQPVFAGVRAMPAAGYATGPVPAGYYSGASYIPGSAAGSSRAAAGQPSLPEAKWTVAPQAFEEATSAEPQGSSALQPGETSNVVKEAEPGNYQQQLDAFGYPAGHMGPGQSLGVGGLWGYSSPYAHPCPFPYPYFDYRLLYGLYPPGTYTTVSRNHEKGKDYYRPGTSRKNMGLMLHKWPRTLELASRRSNQMRT